MRGTTISGPVHGSEEVLAKYRALCAWHKYKCAQGRARPPVTQKALSGPPGTRAGTGSEKCSRSRRCLHCVLFWPLFIKPELHSQPTDNPNPRDIRSWCFYLFVKLKGRNSSSVVAQPSRVQSHVRACKLVASPKWCLSSNGKKQDHCYTTQCCCTVFYPGLRIKAVFCVQISWYNESILSSGSYCTAGPQEQPQTRVQSSVVLETHINHQPMCAHEWTRVFACCSLCQLFLH